MTFLSPWVSFPLPLILATHFITPCPYLLPSSQLNSHGSLLSYCPDWPQRGNTGAKGQCSGLFSAASLAGSHGKPPSRGKPSFFAQLQARPFLAALCSHNMTGHRHWEAHTCFLQLRFSKHLLELWRSVMIRCTEYFFPPTCNFFGFHGQCHFFTWHWEWAHCERLHTTDVRVM